MFQNSFSLSVLVSVFVLLGFVFSAGISSIPDNSDNGETDSSGVMLRVHPIKIPLNIEFAGERMPLEINDVKERMDRELLINTYWHSSSLQMFKVEYRYFPEIEKILKQEGVPDDFKYLALAESGLKDVTSPSSAAGVWQLLKGTAEDMGLTVNDEVDERFHIEKSTHVACKYLKQAHDEFGSWTLAAASYNIGLNRMADVLNRQKVKNYYDLYLNDETSRYVFRIMALKEILTHPHKYGYYLEKDDLYAPLPYTTITIDTTIHDLAAFALQQNTNYKNLKLLNPWLRENSLTVKDADKYQLKMPVGGM